MPRSKAWWYVGLSRLCRPRAKVTPYRGRIWDVDVRLPQFLPGIGSPPMLSDGLRECERLCVLYPRLPTWASLGPFARMFGLPVPVSNKGVHLCNQGCSPFIAPSPTPTFYSAMGATQGVNMPEAQALELDCSRSNGTLSSEVGGLSLGNYASW